MPTTVRDMIKKIEADGWYQVPGGKGSHRKFHHPKKKGLVIIPGQLHDTLKPGTESNIKKAAGIQ